MTTPLPLVLEPAALEPLLGRDDLLIIDLCQPQNWRQLHLPGAVHCDAHELVRGTPPAPGKLPSPKQLEALFARIGYTPDKHIVVYDDEGGGWAGRFIWLLDVIGHTRSSYLNGGLYVWYKEQRPLTQAVVLPTPTPVSLLIDPAPTASLDAVMNAIGNAGIAIWDARSPEEYAGLRSGSARSGHIPGAINLDWVECMDRDNNLKLPPLPELRKRLDAVGITPDKRIITHCQSHHRSGLTYLVAKALGHPVQAYDGSWAEWGNLLETPIDAMA
ncbi:MAG: sulfurtransferase [Pseudohongiellaceae bacterium]